ncbi:MAG: arylsulfatase [Roseibacillus sp.]
MLRLLTPLFFLTAALSGQPNIIIFLADDQGWGDLSLHGNSNLATPHIDSLATDGASFERFFVCPVCAPTRAEFLTGRYFCRTGVSGVSEGFERMNPDELTLAEVFQKAGYATGAFGKWHNGSQHPYHPNSQGFDEFLGFTSGHWGHYFDSLLEHNGKVTRGEGFIIDHLTTAAMDFISENKEKPFLCYLPYCTPHSPMQVPDEFFDRVTQRDLHMKHREPNKEEPAHLKAALAMVENIDWNVGRVLKHLDTLDLSKETIVIYFSDNGPNGWRWNGDMKGRKGSVDEGGVRVPCHIRYPGVIPAGRVIPQIAGAIDLLPTLSKLAGINFQPVNSIDGRNVTPLLRGEKINWPSRNLISVWGQGKREKWSVRNQQYRYLHSGELYDLTNDLGQRTNIAPNHPQTAANLHQVGASYLNEVAALRNAPPKPFSIGHATLTNLPARDGKAHGNIIRSARAPNCSFFSNWTTLEDKITWEVEVHETADYEAILYYTCPSESVGSTIEMSLGKSKVNAKVQHAHDPQLRGAESDRSSRGTSESYVKDFKPLSLGTLKLKKGTDTLTLQAKDIPGEMVADVRLLVIKKKAS